MAVNPWEGRFGAEYTERNPRTVQEIDRRKAMWNRISDAIGGLWVNSVLEIGAGTGNNLAALMDRGLAPWDVYAVEPNEVARESLKGFLPGSQVVSGLGSIRKQVDMVFTYGVMIHVPPDELAGFVTAMVAKSTHLVVAVEYFSAEPRMVPYRGHDDRLWTRDFGKFVLETCPEMTPLACGFEWSHLTGLDDVTWWVFAK